MMRNATQQFEGSADKSVGKRVGDNIYVHVSACPSLSPSQQSIIAQAAELVSPTADDYFNVVKLSQHGDDLSLLDYPSFFDDPFPTLA